jgi:uncharacterized membrane protein YwzB
MKNFLKQNIIGIICMVLMLICTYFCVEAFNRQNVIMNYLKHGKANNYGLVDSKRNQRCWVFFY